ncbi:hypothetical protein [Candidatus Poriferisodalis sp.]|uniref:hypothetical protein n=1 Tax=Candidatus Poriferisodalis sp. TaxID=3101277 RepID=UPI003B52F644
MATHHFEIVTDGTDLLRWETLEALYEAGCTDATIGHNTVEFDREAPSLDEALCSARQAVESVPGVRVCSIRLEPALT